MSPEQRRDGGDPTGGEDRSSAERPIALIGLMATGKTTIGRLIAAELDRDFADTDDLILARTGSTVRELWEQGGEAAYRPLELDAALEALRTEPPVVVGIPGGAVAEAEVRAALADAFVVWLRARPETLAGRVSPNDHRPLLDPDPLAAFEAMAAQRYDLYRSVADLTVDVDDDEPVTLVRAVLDHLEGRAEHR